MIISNKQLSDRQHQEVKQLMLLCQNSDGGLPAIYAHLLSQKRDIESNVFYYDGEHLLGFLSAYFFYEDACEISLFVHPNYRRKKIATQLITTLLPLLNTKKIKNLIFSLPATTEQAWLEKLGFIYTQSEYHMERHSYETILLSNPSLTLQKASLEDIETLSQLDMACFPNHCNNMFARFSYLLAQSNYTILIAFYNSKAIGKAHIRWEKNSAAFSDLAILPEFQRKGLGKELLAHCINRALSQGKIQLVLDVETNNQQALTLYLKQGFKTMEKYNYWMIEQEKLKLQLTNSKN